MENQNYEDYQTKFDLPKLAIRITPDCRRLLRLSEKVLDLDIDKFINSALRQIILTTSDEIYTNPYLLDSIGVPALTAKDFKAQVREFIKSEVELWDRLSEECDSV